jgi:hypothetical protein
MKANHSQIYIIFLTGLLNMSCQKDHMADCFKGTGSQQIEERLTTAFNRIDISDNVEAVIYPGAPFKVKITAGSKLIASISTLVSDSVLYIRNENKCNWVRSFQNKFKAEIWLPEIIELTANGSGDIAVMDTIRYDGFTFNNWNASGKVSFLFNTASVRTNIHIGPGDFEMNGYVGVHYLYNNGDGVCNARNLKTDITYTENKGTNNQYVQVSGELSAKISYVGNIYYTGNPTTVERLGNGSGKLIKAD